MRDLASVPYLDLSESQGRFISSLTFHVDGARRMWIPEGGQLVEIEGSPSEATYFSATAESSNDLYFHSMLMPGTIGVGGFS